MAQTQAEPELTINAFRGPPSAAEVVPLDESARVGRHRRWDALDDLIACALGAHQQRVLYGVGFNA